MTKTACFYGELSQKGVSKHISCCFPLSRRNPEPFALLPRISPGSVLRVVFTEWFELPADRV